MLNLENTLVGNTWQWLNDVGIKIGGKGKKIGAGRWRRAGAGAGAGRASAEGGGQNSFGNISIEDCFIFILSIPSGILRCTSLITTRP